MTPLFERETPPGELPLDQRHRNHPGAIELVEEPPQSVAKLFAAAGRRQLTPLAVVFLPSAASACTR
jgi:hypothetical protein